MISGSRRDSVGGGGSTPEADAIQWGGGVVAEFSRRVSNSLRHSVGGGGSGRIFFSVISSCKITF